MMTMIILKVKVGDNCDNLASGPWTEGYGYESLAIACSGNKNDGVALFLRIEVRMV
jgi:hypothetical protein